MSSAKCVYLLPLKRNDRTGRI